MRAATKFIQYPPSTQNKLHESFSSMPKKTARVIIVDDNDLMRTLLRGILRNEDCLVVGEAKHGLIALELIERHQPDIVFLDVMMPIMDGLEALQDIKKRFPAIRVVMVTGSPSADNVNESISNGASGFIVKPFNTAKVIDTLKRVWPDD